MTERQQELNDLEKSLRRAQERMNQIRRDFPELKQLALPTEPEKPVSIPTGDVPY